MAKGGLEAARPFSRPLAAVGGRVLISAPMSTLAEIEEAVETLPVAEREALFAHLAAQLGRGPAAPAAVARQAGLHAGAWEVAADFDAGLPDEFWLGREA